MAWARLGVLVLGRLPEPLQDIVIHLDLPALQETLDHQRDVDAQAHEGAVGDCVRQAPHLLPVRASTIRSRSSSIIPINRSETWSATRPSVWAPPQGEEAPPRRGFPGSGGSSPGDDRPPPREPRPRNRVYAGARSKSASQSSAPSRSRLTVPTETFNPLASARSLIGSSAPRSVRSEKAASLPA